VGALSNPEVGEFLSQHFIAAYEQVGGFEAVDVDGRVRKNGGNVASYFCTPDGRVIHAVTGPVRANVLLDEANWAVESYRDATSAPWDRAQALTALHRQAVDQRARNNNQQRQIHQLLARRPLPLVSDVQQVVFEQVLGERYRDDESFLGLAKTAFDMAEERRQPVLLILHRDSDNRNARDRWYNMLTKAQQDIRSAGRQRDPKAWQERNRAGLMLSVAQKYMVVGLPINELPALSQHLGIEPYSVRSRGSTILVVARSNGQQVQAMSGWPSRCDLTRAMARGLIAQADQNQSTPAQLRQLRRLVQPIDDALTLQVQQLQQEALARQRG
jgi:hypothetical protein